MKKMTIPKLVMQTWKTKDLPPEFSESYMSVKKYLPDWKHVLIDDNEMDELRTDFLQK